MLRRPVPAALLLACAVACGGRPPVERAAEATPPAVHPTPAPSGAPLPAPAAPLTAWIDYQAHPDRAANLPNNSFAGYHYGGDPLPTASGPLFDVTSARFGADPTGNTDATAAVRRAIDAAVAAGGGIVYLPAGTFQLSGPLMVYDSHVVLRGAGMAQTTLRFGRSLDDSYAHSVNAQGTSNWSEEGGLVWFARRGVAPFPAAAAQVPSNTAWSVGPYRTDAAAALRGDRQLTVADASRLVVAAAAGGDAPLLALQLTNPPDNSLAEHLSGGGAWAAAYPWAPATALAGEVFTYPFEVAQVAGNVLALKQPLRFDIRPEWQPHVFQMNPPVVGSGVESLTIAMQRTQVWDPVTSHHHEVGFNGVFFDNTAHGWAHSVAVVDAEGLAFGVTASRNVTLSDVHVRASSAAMQPHHHAFVVRGDAHDVLVDGFTVDSMPLHGLSVQSRTMGVVFTRGTMAHGTFDTHRLLPLDIIYSQIQLVNDGTAGGDADAGPPMGAHFAVWNVQVSGPVSHVADANLMPQGAVVAVSGVTPASPLDPTLGDSGCFVWTSSAPVMPANLYDAERALP